MCSSMISPHLTLPQSTLQDTRNLILSLPTTYLRRTNKIKSKTYLVYYLPVYQGLRHADENGGGGRGPGGSESGTFVRGNPYQKPKTQRIWPTIFLKMGGLSPALSKMGGHVPPVPPCGGAPAVYHLQTYSKTKIPVGGNRTQNSTPRDMSHSPSVHNTISTSSG